jgi:AcrR family transcriptional regulator
MNPGKATRGNRGSTVEPTPVLGGRRGPRPGGRSARVRSAVLQSAFDLLTEKGIDAFTIAEVAMRAEVHETSIYRRWGTPTTLALEACLHFADAALAIPDTGSLRSDLGVLMQRLIALMSSPAGQAFLALGTSRHPDAVAARRSYFRQRFDLARVIFDRAVSRAEFPRHADPIVFLETLIAPLYLRLLVTGEPLEDWPGAEMVDCLLTAYAAPHK